MPKQPSNSSFRTRMGKVYCDLPDTLAKRISILHNDANFYLPSVLKDHLYTFRAALSAEAGYTDKANLATVEPSKAPQDNGLLSRWKTVNTSKRKGFDIEVRYDQLPCKRHKEGRQEAAVKGRANEEMHVKMNRSMEELAKKRHRPSTQPSTCGTRCGTLLPVQQVTSKTKGAGRKYTYTSAEMYKGYPALRVDDSVGPSSSSL
uniref:Uncharacterized protein n=1 Tax=Branchiostoma floridae TaxID=7739 RepID=C3ZUP8_BRAFL|eukprot:XP_002587749.1 hypothetical protein BRAFLDRAFT_94653 [Branchiostoma floridae]